MSLSWLRTKHPDRKNDDRAKTQKGGANGEDKRKADSGARALLLLGLLLIVLAYVVGFGFQREHLPLFAKDFFFAVATAVLVTWGLTRLMEIPHVTNYVAGKLADLMFGEEYLKNNRPSLPDVRRRIDHVLYGEAALGYPWSLYNFVNNKVHEFYKASFRRNFTVEITCSRTEDRLMRWRERTTYLYVRNTEDSNPATVRLFHDSFFADPLPAAESAEDKRNVFNRFVLNLELRVGDRHFKCRPGDRTELVQVKPLKRRRHRTTRSLSSMGCRYLSRQVRCRVQDPR